MVKCVECERDFDYYTNRKHVVGKHGEEFCSISCAIKNEKTKEAPCDIWAFNKGKKRESQ